MNIIDSTDVVKRFGTKTVLDGFSLNIGSGEICALAGPNGSGKTTFLRLVLGLSRPSAGVISVLGALPGLNRRRVNYLSEDEAIYPHLGAADNIRVSALARGLPAPSRAEIGAVLELVSLERTGRKASRHFSLGMKRRLQFAMCALVHDADLYVLDEPTNGLDINGLLWLKDFFQTLKDKGASVLVATHALDDLQGSITHFAILKDGRLASKTPVHSRSQASAGGIHVKVNERDVEGMRTLFPGAHWSGTTAIITDVDSVALFRALAEHAIVPLSVDTSNPSLSEFYLHSIQEG